MVTIGHVAFHLFTNEIIEILDPRPILIKIKDIFLAFLWELKHYCEMPFRIFFNSVNRYHNLDDPIEFKEKADALCILVHGLMAHPAGFDMHLDLLKQEEGFEVLIPHVPKKGNCALEEAAQPILDKVIAWINDHPGKKVALIGHSNGARISGFVEQKLRELHPDAEVMLVSIAGVHRGSAWFDWGKKMGLDQWFFDAAIWEELTFDSDFMATYLKNLSEMPEDLKDKRRIHCFASHEDSTSTVDTSILPLGTFEILRGVGHNAMLDQVAEKVHQFVKDWVYP